MKPDVDVPPGDALRTAHVAALEKLSGKASGERKQVLALAIEQAKQTPGDPAEDFVRGARRRAAAH